MSFLAVAVILGAVLLAVWYAVRRPGSARRLLDRGRFLHQGVVRPVVVIVVAYVALTTGGLFAPLLGVILVAALVLYLVVEEPWRDGLG